jgi:proline-specific peptidase
MAVDEDVQTGYVESDGIRLYYEIEGTGEPLVLLNGGPGFPHDYLDDLRALATDARLVFYDQRGTGNSDKADPHTYTIEANVSDLEHLRDALQLGRCGIFGHSWGGMLAQAYAVTYPHNVSKLILADTFSSMADLEATLRRMRASVSDETRAIYDKWERAGLYNGRDQYPEEYQHALDEAYEPVTISIPPPPPLQNMFAKVAYDVYRAMWGEESDFKITGTLRAFDVESRVRELDIPVLVIAGASDMPTVAMAERQAGLFRHGRLEIFEHSRHFPFLEEPNKFFRVVREFLRGAHG